MLRYSFSPLDHYALDRPKRLGTGWSLLPIAGYLAGAIEMLWKVGAAIGQFGTGFVFSPMKWAGIGVTGLAIALFLVAGHAGPATRRDPVPVQRPAAPMSANGSRNAATPNDSDIKDIKDILCKRGILWRVLAGCCPIRRNDCARVISCPPRDWAKKITCSEQVGP